MKYLEQIAREDFFALTGSLHTIEQNIKSCHKNSWWFSQKSKMAATKLGQVTLSSKLLTFLNNSKNKSCSAGQNT